MSNTFDKNRIKSIIEYHMRKHRIGGIKYDNQYSSSEDKDGIQGLSNDKDLDKWKSEASSVQIDENTTRFALQENNIQWRDFLTEIIVDILCNATSNLNHTKSLKKLYNVVPSNGNSVSDVDTPYKIQYGDYILKIDETGIFMSQDNGVSWYNPFTHVHEIWGNDTGDDTSAPIF